MSGMALALYALLTAISVALNFFPPFTGVGCIKMLPAALLCVAAFRHTRASFGYRLTLGIFFGMWGDFFLASLDKAWIMPGLIAFLIGHLFYIAAFARDLRFTAPKITVVAVLTLTVAALWAYAITRLMATGQSNLILPGCFYALILTAMAVVCIGHRGAGLWAAYGAVIFIVSDAHIAVNHLFLTTPMLPITLSGYTTYYLAQGLIIHGGAKEAAAAAR